MNTELALKWIEALESGKYPQANGYLYGDKGYCCLGVLCELAGVKWKKDHIYTHRQGNEIYCEGILELGNGGTISMSTMPSEYVLRMVGLQPFQAKTLAHKNDDERWSFTRIAQFLRKHLFDGTIEPAVRNTVYDEYVALPSIVETVAEKNKSFAKELMAKIEQGPPKLKYMGYDIIFSNPPKNLIPSELLV